jgi:hypothetical protein
MSRSLSNQNRRLPRRTDANDESPDGTPAYHTPSWSTLLVVLPGNDRWRITRQRSFQLFFNSNADGPVPQGEILLKIPSLKQH